MKKSLVLAMAMALGVTASAYAANPFSDVPAGHWAYDSIAKLADAGVIEGYGDTTFGGDKLMTRYEMAQIVARAMANGANVDKLAAEFADELDNLGVRVARLEKKADNVKITGQIRYEYAARQGSVSGSSIAKHRLRTRLFVNGQINDNWSYMARLQNDETLDDGATDSTTKLNVAQVKGRLGGVNVTAGKMIFATFGDNVGGYFFDDVAQGLVLSYGKDVKITGYVLEASDYGFDSWYGVNVEGNFGGGWYVGLGYDNLKDYSAANDGNSGAFMEESGDLELFTAQVAYKFDDNLTLRATYMDADLDEADGNLDSDDDGFMFNIAYKGAKASKPGSWGLWATYYDSGIGNTIGHGMKAGDWGKFNNQGEGFEGYGVGVTYALAKNVVYMLDYYDLEGKESDDTSRVLWSRLQITF